MGHIPFVILAYFLNSVAVSIDKFLLVKKIPNPLVYIFFISAFSLIATVLLPFTEAPTLKVFTLASAATLVWVLGVYFMYKGLQIGNVSRVIPVIGTLIPINLLIYARINGEVNLDQTFAVVLLVLGIILLTLPYLRGKIGLREVIYEVLASTLLAVSYILLRQAYTQHDFFSVFVWSRVILIPLGAFILMTPSLRKIVLAKNSTNINMLSGTGVLFLFGQFCGGVGELLITYSISLATPALVNSLQGVQYGFLFILGIILSRKYPEIFKDNLTFTSLVLKVLGILVIGAGLYVMATSAGSGSAYSVNSQSKKVSYGVSFSSKFAKELNLDPQETYIKILDELKVKYIRLPIYWDEFEKEEGKFSKEEFEFYLKEADNRGVKVIAVLGYKQPRWPECHSPKWAKKLKQKELQNAILKAVQEQVKAYREYKNIEAWQVENEPFLPFGDCSSEQPLTFEFVQQEVRVVRGLDARPIIITDSGELSFWYKAASLADIFGSTLYRRVWNPWIGVFDHFIPPVYYRFKAAILHRFVNPSLKDFYISELQAEPWPPAQKPLKSFTPREQSEQFTIKDLKENAQFAEDTRFSRAYFWGVEWWYLMKENGYPQYIEEGKRYI